MAKDKSIREIAKATPLTRTVAPTRNRAMSGFGKQVSIAPSIAVHDGWRPVKIKRKTAVSKVESVMISKNMSRVAGTVMRPITVRQKQHNRMMTGMGHNRNSPDNVNSPDDISTEASVLATSIEDVFEEAKIQAKNRSIANIAQKVKQEAKINEYIKKACKEIIARDGEYMEGKKTVQKHLGRPLSRKEKDQITAEFRGI